ncbi:aminodeoxychorismate synthase component I [Catenovulum sediminis]|uniref:aminodeoxychorismate synthase n=1 Tax=Catenovulum sediminis TaxID=1740262 RepID=A0ABV1RIT0_9ALTE|nr:aminodeoxychorismate synthase component I [Catenovulum sediminis]
MNNSHFISQLELPSDLDSALLFSVVADENGAIFLDSANAEHQHSRYDILLSAPLARLTYKNGITQTKLLQGLYTSESQDDPFKVARRLHAELMPKSLVETDLPFAGGSVGWFTYDLARAIENLPETAQADINLPDMMLGIYDWAIIKDNKTKTWFALDYQPKLKRVERWLQKFEQSTAQPAETFALTSDWQANMSEADYRDKFEQVKKYLHQGDCYQINLAQRFTASFQGNAWSAYLKLRERNKAPFSAFLRTENASVISISPERFLQVTNQKVETNPIKGTIARGQSLKQDNLHKAKLKDSQKDRSENLMIVDLLRNDISKVCQAGSVRVPKLFDIESFPSVHHMVSTITGELKDDKNAFDLLRACFPGGSITGAPKIRAMQIIEELEPHRRSIYCGAIGFIDWRGNMDTNITIRTLVAKENKVHCWGGGGLVYDSNCLSEYNETFDKLSQILPVLKRN